MNNFTAELNQIKKGHIAPVYFLSGKETYLIERVCNELEKQVLGTTADEFNKITYDLEQTPIESVIQEALTLSFFGEKKLILANHAYFFTSKSSRGLVDHQTDILIDYMSAPSPDSVLVLIAPYQKLDGRKKVTKIIKKQAVHLDASTLKGSKASQIAKNYLKDHQFEIEAPALHLLENLTDHHLSKMITELDKLMVYHYADRNISKESVADLVPKNLEQNVFELNDLVLRLDIPAAMRMYQDMRAQKREPIAIVGLLINEFRLLLQTKILSQNGYSQANIAKTLSVHPYRVKLALQKIRPFGKPLLSRALTFLIDADYEMKTGQVDHELVFEMFLMRLTRSVKESA